tara:strand:- start:1951 stop:2580 length:630 start_codon:yes stop_codon:yes gene_type:complete
VTNSGLFITIEGTEGVGKSTQCRMLCDALSKDSGRTVLATREPGGTELGEAIRGLLLDPGLPAMHGTAELLLVFAARAEHLERTIKPALAAGGIVVCDRFTDATFAYQGGGRGLDATLISTLETLVQGQLRPDLTLVLDLDLTLAARRIHDRGDLDRFEQERGAFFERVRAAYLARAAREPERMKLVDANADPETVHRRLLDQLEPLLR